jgi:hypothetical protein
VARVRAEGVGQLACLCSDSMSRRQSGLQKDVFSLLRQLMRAARKEDPNNEHQLQRFVAAEFRAKVNAFLPRARLVACRWLH